MVQKIHPWSVTWIPSISPHAGRLSEKKDYDLAVQYEDVRAPINTSQIMPLGRKLRKKI